MPRRLLAQVYWRAAPSLRYAAPHVLIEINSTPPKIRVGFLSAFVFAHSVGLLTSGVIEHLDRRRFAVILLRVDDGELSDELTARITSRVDEYATIPSSNLDVARRAIAARRLDIIVFCEIGMNTATYFLAFARLARRSILFWGHAVTSGISVADCVATSRFHDIRSPSGEMEKFCGGIDYFVSSELFENATSPSLGQEDYSEQLWLMQGLTTRFARPVSPSTRKLDSILPSFSRRRLYLVPQTLYKLHPDFDIVVAGVLRRDQDAVVAMPEAQMSDWTRSLERRWDLSIDNNSIRSRLVFFKRLSFADFIRLAQLADVVLDPFPVGGGRSSLEVFSVGTPIVMLEERTSVLQLTRGMYELMGWPCPECVTHSMSEQIEAAVSIAQNSSRLAVLRGRILSSNAALYDNDHVVREWEAFLEYTLQKPRPVHPTSRALLAKDEVLGEHIGLDTDPFSHPEAFSYAVRLSHPDPLTGITSNYVVAVPKAKSSTAAEIARAFGDSINAEPVKFRWIATVLQNGAALAEDDPERKTIAVHRLELPDGEAASISVGHGDDLAQVATWRGQQLGLNDPQIEQLRAQLKRLTVEHDSPSWLSARARRDKIAPGSRPEKLRSCFDYEGDSTSWAQMADSPPCELTIGVTTCKRLRYFQVTMRALSRALGVASPVDHPAVCHVIVVDDGSSLADRNAMTTEFADFHFYFKPPSVKGHAHSMNILLRLVETRYFLYLEDDWLALDDATFAHIIGRPLTVHRHARATAEPLVQVIINDQSARACAYAVPNGCGPDILGRAGWRRTTLDGVNYSFHEFGTVDPDHAFTYWPGFTLNPAVWDVKALACAYHAAFNSPPVFNVADRRFEQSFSLRTYDIGLRVAYLPHVTFAHIGVDESAYGLNNISRPWDYYV